MRLLQVNKFYDLRGGAERVLFDLEAGLGERGHEVAVFATRDARNAPSPWQSYFAPERNYDSPSLGQRLRYAAATIHDREARAALSRLLDEFPADVAHLHNIYHQLSPSLLDEFRDRGIPVVLTLHDYKLVCPVYRLFRDGEICTRCVGSSLPIWCGVHRCSRRSASESWLLSIESTWHRWRKSWLRGVDCFVSPSRFLAETVREAGVEDSRLRVIPNAPRAFEPVSEGHRADRPRVLYAGRLSEEKGIDVLIDAAREVPEVDLHIAGDGPAGSELRRRSEGMDHVHWLGRLEAAPLREAMAAAWAIAVPSRWYENAPLSVLEAQASGRAVLAADHGGLPEMIEHDVDGWLLPAGDEKAWADALRRVANSSSKLESMGTRARERAEREADFDSFLDRYEALYRELLESQNPRSKRPRR